MGAYGSGAYGSGPYGGSQPEDLATAILLWQAAVASGNEVGQQPTVFQATPATLDGSLSLGGGGYMVNLSDRISGGYLVISDPRLIAEVQNMPVFTEV